MYKAVSFSLLEEVGTFIVDAGQKGSIEQITTRLRAKHYNSQENSILSIEATLFKKHIRWVEHVTRMPDHQKPKEVLYSELWHSRKSWRALQHIQDMVESTLKLCHLYNPTWKTTASSRGGWRKSVSSAVKHFAHHYITYFNEILF